jgi:Sigma-54 interaction domain
VNCAAIPSGLLESDLFRHVRGAFTGALTPTIGRVQLAHTGTLFLDEIGDLPLEVQPKLLRFLQEHIFEKLRSPHTMRADVRVVAATNQDLLHLVCERRFRADLYHRLQVFLITIAPPRDRSDEAGSAPVVRRPAADRGRHPACRLCRGWSRRRARGPPAARLAVRPLQRCRRGAGAGGGRLPGDRSPATPRHGPPSVLAVDSLAVREARPIAPALLAE